MAITLGLVEAVDASGVYVSMPGSRGVLRGPYETVQDVAVGDRVLTVTTDDGETVIVGLASAAAPRSTPATSTDNTLPRFDGTGGALQSSSVSISDTGVMSGLADGSASTDAITKGYVDSRMPTGSVLAFAGSSAPAGWLLCYGQAVSRATYAGLYAVIGTTYGTGDGSTTFNLPDLRGRTVAGLDNMGGSDAGRLSWQNVLGTVGVSSTTVDSGEEKHTLSAAESGVPAHSHGITDPGHNHNMPEKNAGTNIVSPYMTYAWADTVKNSWYSTYANTTGITVNNNTAAAASTSHNNMQPTMLLNQIIRT